MSFLVPRIKISFKGIGKIGVPQEEVNLLHRTLLGSLSNHIIMAPDGILALEKKEEALEREEVILVVYNPSAVGVNSDINSYLESLENHPSSLKVRSILVGVKYGAGAQGNVENVKQYGALNIDNIEFDFSKIDEETPRLLKIIFDPIMYKKSSLLNYSIFSVGFTSAVGLIGNVTTNPASGAIFATFCASLPAAGWLVILVVAIMMGLAIMSPSEQPLDFNAPTLSR